MEDYCKFHSLEKSVSHTNEKSNFDYVVCTTQKPDWVYSHLFALENTVNYNKNNKHK